MDESRREKHVSHRGRQVPGSCRLSTRVVSPPASLLPPGMHMLALANRREGVLSVPGNHLRDRAPLVVLFHGAGGNAKRGLNLLSSLSGEFGLILFAPRSARTSWDAIHEGFGTDVQAVDAGLEWVCRRCSVDPSRIVSAGFSDGASYALSLGLGNGDIFSHIIAFSPGFVACGERRGKPRIFLSHGKADPVLPIADCGRVIAAALLEESYPVTVCEFDGGHSVPREIRRAAVRWLTSPPSADPCHPA